MPRWQKPAAIALAIFAAAYVATAASAQEVGDYKFTIAQDADHNITGEGHYMLLDGRTLSATAEPDLFAVLGHTFGGTGDDFSLPDMRGRAAVASSGALAVGTAQGAATATLSIANLPAHAHGAGTLSPGGGGGTPEVFTHPGQGEDDQATQSTGLLTSNHPNDNPNVWDGTLIRNAGAGAITGDTASVGSGTPMSVLDPGLVIGAAFMLVDAAVRTPSGPPVAAADVAALLHFDDGAGDLTVVSLGASTASLNDTPTQATANTAFGAGAAEMGAASNDAIQVNAVSGSLDFGTGDFTWEAHVRTTYTGTVAQELFSNGLQPQIYYAQGSDNWVYDRAGGAADAVFSMAISGAVFEDGNFHHVVWMRKSGTIYMAVDGKWSTTTHADGTNMNLTQIDIGNIDGFADPWAQGSGQIDEVRISRVAVYDETQDFTPPSAPFPDS